jgi:Ca2+-binding EF-hand superfamily protein
MDKNRDGVVSRQEYLNSRARTVPPSVRGTWRERPYAERAQSRFRSSDQNGDGRITPDEMPGASGFAPGAGGGPAARPGGPRGPNRR